MAIPESQLQTWAKQGAITQSRNTYAIVKNALESSSSPYYVKTFESFLQGSYGNDTNVYRESDVDVVMRLDSVWYHDANLLPANEYQAFEHAYPGSATYSLPTFKREVLGWLQQRFDGVRAGSKAILIPGNGGRRDCDVLVCARFRYYYNFTSKTHQNYVEGIRFLLGDGSSIVNFPKQHSENCAVKHQATSQWFKPLVRIHKNLRNRMVDAGVLSAGIAPSYFIEGLLWNASNSLFGTSYSNTFTETANFLIDADRTEFRCANGIHKLLGQNSPVSWDPSHCQQYLDAISDFWNKWR